MSPFALMFMGMLLIGFDVRVGGVDVIPDFAGYALALVALRRLGLRHPAFRAAWLVALIFALLAVGELLLTLFGVALPGAGPRHVTPVSPALGIPAPRVTVRGNDLGWLLIITQAVYAWLLCAGVTGLAAAVGRYDLAGWARWLQRFQASAAAGTLIISWAVLRQPAIAIELLPMIMILAALPPLLIGLLMLQAASELGAGGRGQALGE